MSTSRSLTRMIAAALVLAMAGAAYEVLFWAAANGVQ